VLPGGGPRLVGVHRGDTELGSCLVVYSIYKGEHVSTCEHCGAASDGLVKRQLKYRFKKALIHAVVALVSAGVGAGGMALSDDDDGDDREYENVQPYED